MGSLHIISTELDVMTHIVQLHNTVFVPVSALSGFPYTSFLSPSLPEWLFLDVEYSAQASVPRNPLPGLCRLA